MVPTVAACLDLVVHLAVDQDGKRRVQEVVGVPGRVEDDIIEIEPIFTVHEGRLMRAQGMPPRAERFARVGIDLSALLGESGGR